MFEMSADEIRDALLLFVALGIVVLINNTSRED